jgi:hypothetical protein
VEGKGLVGAESQTFQELAGRGEVVSGDESAKLNLNLDVCDRVEGEAMK